MLCSKCPSAAATHENQVSFEMTGYIVSGKKILLFAMNNFIKYWPILKIISQPQSLKNLQYNKDAISLFFCLFQTNSTAYHASPSSVATETTAAETSLWPSHAVHPCLYEVCACVLICRPCPPKTRASFGPDIAVCAKNHMRLNKKACFHLKILCTHGSDTRFFYEADLIYFIN